MRACVCVCLFLVRGYVLYILMVGLCFTVGMISCNVQFGDQHGVFSSPSLYLYL